MLLPDEGDPGIASPDEYDPLSADWGAMMEARCERFR